LPILAALCLLGPFPEEAKAGPAAARAAAGGIDQGKTSPVTFVCLEDISRLFQVPLSMLLLVMDVEQGKVGKESRNRNGSKDYGPMQINSVWLPKLQRLGITEDLLRDHGCVNAAAAAWLLRSHLIETRDPLKAISVYHSRRPDLKKRYLKTALDRARRLDVERTINRANNED
jgi:hypothetical protein